MNTKKLVKDSANKEFFEVNRSEVLNKLNVLAYDTYIEKQRLKEKESKRKRTEISEKLSGDKIMVECSNIATSLLDTTDITATKSLSLESCEIITKEFESLGKTVILELILEIINSFDREESPDQFQISSNIFGKMLGLDDTSFNSFLGKIREDEETLR